MFFNKWMFFNSLLSLFIGWFVYNYFKNWFYNLPPGPIGFPFLGCIPYLDKTPERIFYKWSQKYGPVFQLTIGTDKTVVLNSYEAIEEVKC